MIERSGSPEISGDGIDAEEDRLRRSLLIFACALMNFSVMLWLAIYWFMGLNFSTNFPLAYQLFSISSLIFYLKTNNFVARAPAKRMASPRMVQMTSGRTGASVSAVLGSQSNRSARSTLHDVRPRAE